MLLKTVSFVKTIRGMNFRATKQGVEWVVKVMKSKVMNLQISFAFLRGKISYKAQK